jgi:hypothetical protein
MRRDILKFEDIIGQKSNLAIDPFQVPMSRADDGVTGEI